MHLIRTEISRKKRHAEYPDSPDGVAVPQVRVQKPKKKPQTRVPREIVGRLGLGPIEWKSLLKGMHMEVDLLTLAQISPEMATNAKKPKAKIVSAQVPYPPRLTVEDEVPLPSSSSFKPAAGPRSALMSMEDRSKPGRVPFFSPQDVGSSPAALFHPSEDTREASINNEIIYHVFKAPKVFRLPA